MKNYSNVIYGTLSVSLNFYIGTSFLILTSEIRLISHQTQWYFMKVLSYNWISHGICIKICGPELETEVPVRFHDFIVNRH